MEAHESSSTQTDPHASLKGKPYAYSTASGGDRHQAAVLDRIKSRRRFTERVFQSADSFSSFLEERIPEKAAREAWLRTAVQSNVSALKVMAARPESAGLLTASDAEKYQALVVAGYLDPATDFPDKVPPAEPICNLMRLLEKYPDGRPAANQPEVRDELRRSVEYFKRRWEQLTGVVPLEGQPIVLPNVGDLVSRKAPVPFRTAWSSELFTAEERSLRHSEPNNPRPAAAARQPSGNGAPAAPPEEEVPEAGAPEAEGGESEGMAEAPAKPSGCDLDDIYRLAGASRPSPLGEGDLSYTFPGGRLSNTEEIYYDYVVIRPVDECGPFRDPKQFEPRDLTGPHMLAARARSVLRFLKDMHLEGLLGQRVTLQDVNGVPQEVRDSFGYNQLDSLLNTIELLDANSPLADALSARRSLRRAASVLRVVSRTEINLSGVGAQDPIALRAELEAAMSRFDNLFLYEDYRIVRDVKPGYQGIMANDPPPTNVDYLGFRGVHPSPDFREGGAGPESVTDPHDLTAGDVDYTEGHYFLEIGNQDRHTKYYLEYLATTFYDNIVNLRGKVSAVAEALRSLETPVGFFRELATDLIYQALFALARLLEEAAEMLDLPPQRRRDGNKRLALMLVYRQHWFPAGYVQGKLVGYKNLAPGQTDRVVRRTLVRTTRETTTSQEFAATRSQDYSQSLKETGEFVRENASKFNLTASASGHFDIVIGGLDASLSSAVDLSQTSRATQTRMSEVTAKSSVLFNEKREVKVRELVETEQALEVTSEVRNANQEITANYFYYQLLRQYEVVTEFHDMVPVLLRTREMPSPAEVDDSFLNTHAHVLVGALPLQLASDLESTVHQIDYLARSVVRRRVEMEQRAQAWETARQSPPPADADGRQGWEARLQSLERVAADARTAYGEAEEAYLPARARMDRVVSHVREHIAYYMQYLWQASPTVDHDRLLAEENFGGVPLPDLTRGLIRLGYYGDEEIFEFDGPSVACADILARHAVDGPDVVAAHKVKPVSGLTVLQERFGPTAVDAAVGYVFLRDPAGPHVINHRTVQLAQDALVVETLPGRVPLLEGFKMAHRMLDVRKVCLENEHLAARIADRPWTRDGEDTYRVVRRETADGPLPVQKNEKL